MENTEQKVVPSAPRVMMMLMMRRRMMIMMMMEKNGVVMNVNWWIISVSETQLLPVS